MGCVTDCQSKNRDSLQQRESYRRKEKGLAPTNSSEGKENIKSPAHIKSKYVQAKPTTEAQLRKDLDEIFDRYDCDKNGRLNVPELRNLLNSLEKRKTGKDNRYSLAEIQQFMYLVDKSGEMSLTKEAFYNFYKKI